MKHLLLIIISVLFSTILFAQKTMITGRIDSLQSTILKENRPLWVHVPMGHKVDQKKKYPVVYVLDGDDHFVSVVSTIERMSASGIMPEMIVVGVINTDRTRDLTTSHDENGSEMIDSAYCVNSGQAEHFSMFFEKELKLFINDQYPAANFSMLIGHSFGGLFAVNAMFNHPHLFNAIIATDPSMWWDDFKLLETIESRVAKNDIPKNPLFLGIANTMSPGMDTSQVVHDTTSDTWHINGILKFDRLMKKAKQNYGSAYYPDDDHHSVTVISMYDGLRSVFKNYKFSITEEEVKGSDQATYDKVLDHYNKMSELMCSPVLPDEELINELGYYALLNGHSKLSYQLFSLNIQNYPASWNTYDSMGDYYLHQGKLKQAKKSFEMATAINPDEMLASQVAERIKEYKKSHKTESTGVN